MSGRISYYGNIVRDGLILDLDAAKLDSYPKTGSSWRDIVGGVITGSLINNPEFDSNNGGSIVFNGTSNYVALPQSTTNQTVGNYSFSIWIRFTNTMTSSHTSNFMFVEAQNIVIGGVDNYLYMLSNATVAGTNGRIGFQTFNPLSVLYTTTNNWVGGQWYNITCTYNISTSTQSIYVNGVFENSTTIANCYFNTNSYFGLGAYSTPSRTWFFSGRLSSFMLYAKTLSAAEILRNYNAIKTRYGL
jgi:hypothetical protein